MASFDVKDGENNFYGTKQGTRMPLNLYAEIYESGAVPQGWIPVRGGALKYPVRNRAVLRELRLLRVGKWKKGIK